MPNNQIQSLTISGTTYDIVDNTSGYIIADSPVLTGTPTAPTPLSGADDTQIATVKYVQDAMAGAGAGTVTSVGVANATDGGLSVSGSPVTSSGTISVGHSNVLASAQTTSGIYPIKIDKNGHISEYGSAVSIPTIALNGSSTTSPSFYAPTTAGTSGYVLTSNGSGAPTWTAVSGGTIVNLTITYDPITTLPIYTADMTYAEILAEAALGHSVILIAHTEYEDEEYVDGYRDVYYLTEYNINDDSIPLCFTWAICDDYNSMQMNSFWIDSSNNIWQETADLSSSTLNTKPKTTDMVYYLLGVYNQNEAEDFVYKNSSLKADITADTVTSGYTRLDLGNSTATSSAGGKEGIIRLYGSAATYYTDLKSSATNNNKTITLPDKTGTIALTSDIPTVPTKTSDLTNDSGFITGMTILSYGSSTWQDFLNAYNANKVVYCRASSNSNPATGSQTRLAFMAYVNNATNPTSVEFQYYRSVNTHTASQQGDQVYVYTLTSAGSWSVTAREASVKVAAGTGLSGTYSNGTMTLDHSNTLTSAQTTQAVYPIKIDVNGHISEYGEAVTIPDVSGKIDTAGTGLSKSGTTLNHSNSVAAQTTQAIYPIKIDAQGHISDYGSAVSVPTKVSELQNDSGFIISPNVVYCTCGTASSTVIKVATIESGSLTSLNEGDQAIVKFTNSNAIASPMLKIGDTDAKSIMRYGTTAPSTSAASSWNAGSAVLFIYDGTYWQMVGWLNTTYSEISATNITNGSNATTGLITGRRAKAAVEAFAPVKDVTVGGTSVMSGTTAVVPAIPTVNDATLTIQKNGTNVATFTANASSNVTANISVPTDTGDLTNGAGYITSAGGTSTPTASTVAEFDSNAHMNSGDMSAQDVSDFVDNLNTGAAMLFEDVSDKFTFDSSWTSQIKNAWRIGNTIFFVFSGYMSTIASGTLYIIATIADGYRPISTLPFTGHTTNSSYVPQGIVNCYVWTSGEVSIRANSNSGNYVYISGYYRIR